MKIRYIIISFFLIVSFEIKAQEQYPRKLPKVDAQEIPHYSEILEQTIEFDSAVYHVIQKINLDSLTQSLRILSGEDSVWVLGNKVCLKNRFHANNDTVALFLKQKLESYDLEIYDQPFNDTGRNIYGIQSGCDYPDQFYIICAHYDAVTDYAADDNATGVAAVLEAARILTKHDLKYSLIYALWDEEEIGLYGSSYFAKEARENNLDIKGVLNLDMLGWDSNSDNLMDIHSSDTNNSDDLANILLETNMVYDIGLNPVVYNPGTKASDHSSFWANNYPAILLIEAYYGGDFNLYYHSIEDRIATLNMTYFHKTNKLALGSIAVMADIIEYPYFYLDNGITIKCKNCQPGDLGDVNGTTYEAVDRTLLEQRLDEGSDLTIVCTSLVTDMNSLFLNNIGFNQDIRSWDVSNVLSMDHMFYGASSFNQDLSGWCVENISDATDFATECPLQPEFYPVWGTCPGSTKIDVVDENNLVSIFPNPIKATAFIETGAGNLIRRMELIDLTGKVIRNYNNINSNKTEINCSQLQGGLYLLKVYADKLYLKKVIVE